MFVVLYRWRLHPGAEEGFIQSWSKVTELLKARGSLGSRLHRGSDGLWYGYAQWPSADARAAAFAAGSVDPVAMTRMGEAIAESLPEVVLDVMSDYIVAQPTLETQRLQLRLAALSDAAFFVKLLNDPAWLQNIGDRGIRTETDAEGYVRNAMREPHRKHGFGMWVMQLKTTERPIGVCGLVKREYLDHPDLGFALLPADSRQNYAFEAAVACLTYARVTLQLPKLYAIVSRGNERSIRLLLRLGFRLDGPCVTPQGAEVHRYVTDLAPSQTARDSIYQGPRVTIRSAGDISDAFVRGLKYGGLLLREEDLCREFFDLRSGLAGELFQKFASYGGRLALVVADPQLHGERFSELAYEHRRHPAVRFFASEPAACEWLGAQATAHAPSPS